MSEAWYVVPAQAALRSKAEGDDSEIDLVLWLTPSSDRPRASNRRAQAAQREGDT